MSPMIARPRTGPPIRTALLGYGKGGSIFHAPFIDAEPAMSLDVVVTGNSERAREAAARYARVRIVPDVDEVFANAASLDAVVISTPPPTHAALAERALRAGLAVVVDKPFAVSAGEARRLLALAAETGVPLTVFQNRRWDGDFRTLRSLLDDGVLGQVFRFESRFEWWRPATRDSWKDHTRPDAGGGVLFDIGAHLIDQAIQLFGPVGEARAELATRRVGAAADDDSFVSIAHVGGVRSHLWMNSLAAQRGPRFRVLGSTAAFTSFGLDPQEGALLAGARPGDGSRGIDAEPRWGTVWAEGEESVRVPVHAGDYRGFYAEFAAALTSGSPLPVDPADSATVIEIIESLHATGLYRG